MTKELLAGARGLWEGRPLGGYRLVGEHLDGEQCRITK